MHQSDSTNNLLADPTDERSNCGVGVVVDFESFVPTDAFGTGGEAAGRIGIGGVLGVMNRFLGLLAQLDDLARLFGALLLLLSTVVFGAYLLTREQVLAVAVAGDAEDIAVPGGEADVAAAVTALERELFEESGPATDAGSGAETGPGTDAGSGAETGPGTDAGRTDEPEGAKNGTNVP